MERYDLNAVPNASSEKAGVLRVANEVDEKNCGCNDAAITPSNLYSLLDCRKANTAYTAGAIVSCPYHKEFLLKCTTGGTTSANSLDTTAVTKGNVITDGGVKWTVIASQIIDIAISGKTITVTFIDGTNKTLITQDTEKPADMNDYIIESYRNGANSYAVYKSGKIEQTIRLESNQYGTGSNGRYTVNLLKPMNGKNYVVMRSIGLVDGAAYARETAIVSKSSTSFVFYAGDGHKAKGTEFFITGQGA